MTRWLIWVSETVVCLFFSSTGYQVYKKHLRCGSPEEDSEAEVGGGEKKDRAVENNAFECDEHGNSEEKDKDMSKNTQLWDHTPANHRLWTISTNTKGLTQLWTHTALCRPSPLVRPEMNISCGGAVTQDTEFCYVELFCLSSLTLGLPFLNLFI